MSTLIFVIVNKYKEICSVKAEIRQNGFKYQLCSFLEHREVSHGQFKKYTERVGIESLSPTNLASCLTFAMLVH